VPKRKESNEERQFEAWADEAVKHGLVRHYVKQPDSWELIPARWVMVEKQLKTKTKTVEKSVCRAHSYTADFRLRLTPLGMELFRGVFQKTDLLGFPYGRLYLDTKGGFQDRGSTAEFSINQKLVYEKTGIWVAKVVPWVSQSRGRKKCLFLDTWCPHSLRWMTNRKMPTLNAMGSECLTVEEWIDGRGKGK